MSTYYSTKGNDTKESEARSLSQQRTSLTHLHNRASTGFVDASRRHLSQSTHELANQTEPTHDTNRSRRLSLTRSLNMLPLSQFQKHRIRQIRVKHAHESGIMEAQKRQKFLDSQQKWDVYKLQRNDIIERFLQKKRS